MAFDYDSIEQQLRLAAKSGDAKQVEALLAQGADMDAAPVSDMTALRLALKYQHHDIARLLLRRGAAIALEDAQSEEQLRFLQANGVEGIAPSLEYRRLLRHYEWGTLSWKEVQIAAGKLPDPTLIAQTTVEAAEAAYSSTGTPFGYINGQWEKLKAQMQPGDELWEYDNGLFDQLAGESGYKLLRQGRLVARIITRLN